MYKEKEFQRLIEKLSGINLLYKKDGVYIIKVSSFKSCKKLFNDDSIDWCIAKGENHWNNYVSYLGNNQYFIVDFNDIKSKNSVAYNNSLVGFTITKHGELYAAHARNDKNLLRTEGYSKTIFAKLLLDKNLYDFVINEKMATPYIQREESSKSVSMVPVYLLIGSILLAMMTLLMI